MGQLVDGGDPRRDQPGHRRGDRLGPGRRRPRTSNRAVAAAKRAFEETWFDSTPKDRQLALLKLADAIEANADEIVRLEAVNVGKPYDGDDVRGDPADRRQPPVLRGRRADARGTLAPASTWPGSRRFVRREPIGVAGLIAPWNYPLMMAIWKIGPALATGNTIVLKPSELTPLTAIKLAELAADIFPAGVFNVITGDGVPVGDTLVRHPDVGIVSLTGDVDTGKLIHTNASETLKRVHLELGGKAPVVVFDDADLASVGRVDQDRRVLQRRAGLHRGRRACWSVRSAYDKVLSELVPAVESHQDRRPLRDGHRGRLR